MNPMGDYWEGEFPKTSFSMKKINFNKIADVLLEWSGCVTYWCLYNTYVIYQGFLIKFTSESQIWSVNCKFEHSESRNSKLKTELETQNSKLKVKLKTQNSKLKAKLKTEQNLKLGTQKETRNLKLETQSSKLET